MLVDDNVEIAPENAEEYDDYYFYELSQHVSLDKISKKFNISEEELKKIIDRSVDRMVEIKAILQESANKNGG